MKNLKRFQVVLKDGRDYNVRAKNKADAIKRVRAGKGRRVGFYVECEETSRDQAYLIEGE